MRTASLVLLVVVAAGCGSDKCKDKTVLVNVSFDATARAAETIDVVVTLDGDTRPAVTVPGPRGKDTGTLQVEFPSGYHAGSTLDVTVAADVAGQTVATGSASTTLVSGCTVLTLSVDANGGGDDLSMPADMTVMPNAVIAAKPDLVGFTTSLDGSGSNDPLGDTLGYAWAVQQAPAGSQVTTASLASTTNVKTTFAPDLGGVYKIALTVTASDGRATTTVSDVTVPTVPLFYSRASANTANASLGARVMQSDGTGDRYIGCPFVTDQGIGNSGQFMPFYGHAYEPAMAGGTPLFVFLSPQDPSVPPPLMVGSAATDCTTTPPTRVDNNVFNDHIPVTARFSPDGKRIVYVDMPQNQSMATYRLVTVSSDGTGPKHVVRSDGYFGFTPAIWLDNTTVAWLERDGTSTNPFTIWKAPDENAAGDPGTTTKRTQVLRCDQSTNAAHLGEINQFEMSAFGLIVAGGNTRCLLCNPPMSAVNLYKLAANDCSTTNAKTLATEPTGGLSWDFSISPDGLNVLFSSTHGQSIPDGGAPEPQTDVFFVPADGSAAAQKIAGDPLYDDISPRFVALGRQFIWTRTPRNMDMGADTPAIMIANADGTHVRALTSDGNGDRVLSTDVGANRGYDCEGVPGAASAGGASATVGVALLLLMGLRRRRRD